MDLFKVADASEALRALDMVHEMNALKGNSGAKGGEPDFSFITPNLLAIGKLVDKEIDSLLSVIGENVEGQEHPQVSKPSLTWNIR